MLSGYPPPRDYERFEEEGDGEMKQSSFNNLENPRRQSRQSLNLDVVGMDQNQPVALDHNLISNLKTSIGLLTAQRVELRYKLSEIESQLASQVQALQMAQYPPSPREPSSLSAEGGGRSFDFGKRSSSRSSVGKGQSENDTTSLLNTNESKAASSQNRTTSFELPPNKSYDEIKLDHQRSGFSASDINEMDTVGPLGAPLTSSFDMGPGGGRSFVTRRLNSGASDITDVTNFNNGGGEGGEASPPSQSKTGFGRMFSTSSRINSFDSEGGGEDGEGGKKQRRSYFPTLGVSNPSSESRRTSFNSARPKTLERNFSFSIEGMTEAEVQDEIIKTTSKHARSQEEVNHKLVTVRREPQLLEEPHEETFFELFYDLILVVVFIKLSYLKYDMTANGILTVAAIFSNFWSCWSLMNCYATMLHTEDMVHRFYYVAHITASFIMAITINHPNHSFFHYSTMAQYHAGASVMCRSLTLLMWAYAYHNDLENTREEGSLFLYSHKHIRKQIGVHFFSILIAMVIFSITIFAPWSFVDHTHESIEDTWHTAVLWILAVFIEQFGTGLGAVFMKLPFPAIYAGARMQAWLMLCFGESVIGLLIEPIFYDSGQFGSLIAAFFMILALCTTYFDIVNADQFLHLFMVRKEKYKAFAYMNFQLPFSFSIFLGGVGLKNILYVSNAVFKLEVSEGCAGHHGTTSSYGSSYSSYSAYSSSYTSYASSNELFDALEFESELSDSPRRLASTFSVLELDHLLKVSFELLTYSFTAAMVASILIGYGMPIELPFWQVHISRIGAVCSSLVTLIIPQNLQSLATPCLLDKASDDGVSRSDAEGYHSGLSLMQGLVTISMIMIFSFFVALGSLDPNREETYTKLEVEAHYELAKKVLTQRAARKKNIFVDMYNNALDKISDVAETITNNIPDVFTDNVVTNNMPTVFSRSSFVEKDDDDDGDIENGEGKKKKKQKKKKKKKKERSPSPPLSRKRNAGVNQKIFIRQESGDSVTTTREKYLNRGDKITIPSQLKGQLGKETNASKNRQVSLETGAAEEQIKLTKNTRQNASKTLTNAKSEWEARDKVTKVQNIGNLNKETEASKNRKVAVSVENTGSSEMAARSNRDGRRESSKMMTDAKAQWEKRRAKQKEALLLSGGSGSSGTVPQDIGRLGKSTVASNHGKYEPKSRSEDDVRGKSPMPRGKSPARENKSPVRKVPSNITIPSSKSSDNLPRTSSGNKLSSGRAITSRTSSGRSLPSPRTNSNPGRLPSPVIPVSPVTAVSPVSAASPVTPAAINLDESSRSPSTEPPLRSKTKGNSTGSMDDHPPRSTNSTSNVSL